MADAGNGANVRLTGHVNVWFDEKQSSEIHLTINDEDVAHPTSGKEGLHLVVSRNPGSANFDPKSFNTLRSLLAAHAKPHPIDDADESIPRRLDRRHSYLEGQSTVVGSE